MPVPGAISEFLFSQHHLEKKYASPRFVVVREIASRKAETYPF